MNQQTPKQVIKALLKQKGIKQKDIAEMLAIKPASVSEVVGLRRKNPRIRKAISMAVGRPVSELWPEDQTQSKEES